MSRIAIVRASDDDVRSSDDAVRPSDVVREAIAAGHELVAPADCEVRVVLLRSDGEPVAFADRPTVAVIDPGPSKPPFGYEVCARSVLQTRADAFVSVPRSLGAAIAWVTVEDRAARTTGPPRLVVIGTNHDDYGMVRAIPVEPLIIGRAMSFGQHPQRPDRLPTPTGSIARHHARVRYVAGAIAIADMGSTNGTLVIRRGEPTRLLNPQERGGEPGKYGPPAAAWLIRDPDTEWTRLQIGDEIQLASFWRFRIDGQADWRPDHE